MSEKPSQEARCINCGLLQPVESMYQSAARDEFACVDPDACRARQLLAPPSTEHLTATGRLLREETERLLKWREGGNFLLDASVGIKTQCRRCRQDKPHSFILSRSPKVTWAKDEDFIVSFARPPEHEVVCRDCLTDSEIATLLSPALCFVLGVLVQELESKDENADQGVLKSLAHVRAWLSLRTYVFRPVEAHKELALRALEGLKSVPIPEIDMNRLYTELSIVIGQKMFLAAHPDDMPEPFQGANAFRDKVKVWFSSEPFAGHALRAAIAETVELFKKYFTRRTV